MEWDRHSHNPRYSASRCYCHASHSIIHDSQVVDHSPSLLCPLVDVVAKGEFLVETDAEPSHGYYSSYFFVAVVDGG